MGGQSGDIYQKHFPVLANDDVAHGGLERALSEAVDGARVPELRLQRAKVGEGLSPT